MMLTRVMLSTMVMLLLMPMLKMIAARCGRRSRSSEGRGGEISGTRFVLDDTREYTRESDNRNVHEMPF